MEVQVLGALAGAFVGWLISAILGPGGHFEAPNFWVWDTEGAIGCLGQLAIVSIFAFIGFLTAPFFV